MQYVTRCAAEQHTSDDRLSLATDDDQITPLLIGVLYKGCTNVRRFDQGRIDAVAVGFESTDYFLDVSGSRGAYFFPVGRSFAK